MNEPESTVSFIRVVYHVDRLQGGPCACTPYLNFTKLPPGPARSYSGLQAYYFSGFLKDYCQIFRTN